MSAVVEGDMADIQKLTPCLWFDNQGEEAAKFYTSIFPNSRVGGMTRYGDAGPGEPGAAMTVEFELCGQRFTALNGGPMFSFGEAISFQISCEDQSEVDYYWDALTAGGEESQCGWLKDKFGLSWQVVPKALPALLDGSDAAATGRAMNALFGMTKIDIAEIQRAHEGVEARSS